MKLNLKIDYPDFARQVLGTFTPEERGRVVLGILPAGHVETIKRAIHQRVLELVHLDKDSPATDLLQVPHDESKPMREISIPQTVSDVLRKLTVAMIREMEGQ